MNVSKNPLYLDIIEYIVKKIEAGEFVQHQAIPNERELAELFDVSRITSKRALEELQRSGIIYRKRGSGSYVSPVHQRQNVALVENGRPTAGVSNVVALVLTVDASDSGMLDTIKGASEVLNEYGYFLSIHNTHEDQREEKQILQELINRNVAGIIYYPYSDRENIEFLINLLMKDFPIVAIDRYIESIPLSYVVSDNFDGAYKVTEHLIKNGHRKIAYFSSASVGSATSARNRYMGYCKALKDYGLPIDSSIIINDYARYSTDAFGNEYTDLISNIINYLISKQVTAIQTLNDQNAITIEKACMSMGLKIPADMCIVGFDNLDASQHVEVPLTTVKQDFYMMGKIAAEMIVKMIRKNTHAFTAKTIPVELVEKESSAKVIMLADD